METGKRNKIKKKITRITVISLTILLLLLLSLRIPYIQTQLGKFATKRLSSQLNSTVSVDKIRINFLDNANLKGIYLEDQNQDTLIYCQNLNVELAFWKLLSKKIEIEEISLDSAIINLVQNQDSILNYQFLVDYFASEDTSSKDTSKIQLDIKSIALSQIQARANFLGSSNSISLEQVNLGIRTFDIDKYVFEIDQFLLDGAQIISLNEPQVSSETNGISEDAAAPLAFPLDGLPFQLSANKISILNTAFKYSIADVKPGLYFDSDFIDIAQFNFQATDFELDSSKLRTTLDGLQFYLNDAFVLNDLKSEILLTKQKLKLSQFRAETAESEANANAEMAYDNFGDLLAKLQQVSIDLAFSKVELALPELSYFFPEIDQMEQLRPFRKKKLRLSGNAKGSLDKLLINDFQASISETQLKVNGTLSKLLDFEQMGFRNLDIKAKSAHKDFKVFISDQALKNNTIALGNVRLNSLVNGNMKKINFTNMSLNTNAQLNGKFNGFVAHPLDQKQISYALNIQNITTGKSDFTMFMDSIPELLMNFDTLLYSGKVTGNLTDIAIDGTLNSSLGDLSTDIALKFDQDYSNANYLGKLNLTTFDLGKLLANDSLDLISVQAEVDGRGLTIDSILSSIKANISSIDYNSYQYHDIIIDGVVDGKKFSGNANFNDENLAFDFAGAVDLNDSIPLFTFDLNLDTVNFVKLNLIEQPYSGSLRLKADMAGMDIDNINGNLEMVDVNFWNGDARLLTDTVRLLASRNNDIRSIDLSSDYINAEVKGEFSLSLLPDVILDFLDQYFPLKQFLGPTNKEDDILNEDEVAMVNNDVISLEMELNNLLPLLKFIEMPVTRFDTSRVSFELDAPNNLSKFELYIPALEYDGYYADSLFASASNEKNEAVEGIFKIDSISISESVHLSQANFNFQFKDQKASISALLNSQENYKSLGFKAEIVEAKKNDFKIQLVEDLILNNGSWKVDSEAPVTLGQKGLQIPTTTFSRGKESLAISGMDSELLFDFSQFDLANLIEIVGIDSMKINGLMNGKLEVEISEDLPVLGYLDINEIKFNDYQIGNLNVNATKELEKFSADLKLMGQEAELTGVLAYNLEQGNINGEIDLEKLNLAPFNPLLSEYAEDVKGTLFGKMDIAGDLSRPNIDGQIFFKDVSAFIKDLNTKYKIKEGSLLLAEGVVKPNITLADEKDRLSFLNGNIKHDYFQDFILDLDFTADRFTFLNAPKQSDLLFYGKLVGKVDATIKGNLELPYIDANVSALEETDLTIQLLSSEAVLTEENYIVFYDGSKISSLDQIDSIANVSYNNENSFDLDLKLNTSSKANFHVIIDPITGDRLDINGNSNLLIKLPSKGDLTINGEYLVEKGKYHVSYENAIRRDFAIDKDSKIIFQGDPYDAQLALRAIYSTKASIENLVANIGALTQEEITSSKEDVNIILLITGAISKPTLEFDIQIPDRSNSPLGSNVSTALTSLRQNETRLLEQVFSIILFNSFTGGTSGGNLDNLGASTAISSVGNLINGQLNRLASNTKGFEIKFDLDQYKNKSETNSNGNVTEIDLGLSQRLFDDRLIISAGGNANLESGTESTSNFTSLAGDFVIQYLLTKDGKYRVKVFQKSDYNALSNESVWKTGFGLTYKTKFGKIKPREKGND